MTQVAEGIHRLTNGISNFYLIEQSGKLVLVDAGAPRDWHLLGRVVAGLGRDLGDLDAMLLTHAHTDHTGFAEQARATTGARVWVHEDDVQMARTGKVGPRDGKTSSYLLRAAFWRTALVLGRRGATKIIVTAASGVRWRRLPRRSSRKNGSRCRTWHWSFAFARPRPPKRGTRPPSQNCITGWRP